MSLANFFEKNALAAAQLLNGLDPDALAVVLNRHTVAVVFDNTVLLHAEAATTLELSVNLAARLYPRLCIACLEASDDVRTTEKVGELEASAKAINPQLSIGRLDEATAVVVIGEHALNGLRDNVFVVYAGSRIWHALVSTKRPMRSGDSANPFGAAAAACFALANVFRHVFAAYLADPTPDTEFALSLVDYTVHACDDFDASAFGLDIGAAQHRVHLGETIIAGVGAIGNAAVWTLARVGGLGGLIVLVDDQEVTLSNLQRYVLTTQRSYKQQVLKVDLAEQLLRAAPGARSGELEVRSFAMLWGDYLAARADFALHRVATAFDTVEARLSVQAALPKRIVNAWTQQSDLGVSRHPAFGRAPCLGCIYRPKPGGRSDADLIADAMRVPEPAMEIRELLVSGAPITEEFIRGVAARREIIDEARVALLLQYVGQPLRAFYQEAFCGELILRLGGSADAATAASAPIAFQSALAGVMLASEIVLDAFRETEGVSSLAPTRTVIDLLRPLHVYVPTVSRRRDGQCLCNDEDYLAVFAEKWDGRPATSI